MTLRELRTNRGMTLAQLGAVLGHGASWVHKLETGKKTTLSMRDLRHLLEWAAADAPALLKGLQT